MAFGVDTQARDQARREALLRERINAAISGRLQAQAARTPQAQSQQAAPQQAQFTNLSQAAPVQPHQGLIGGALQQAVGNAVSSQLGGGSETDAGTQALAETASPSAGTGDGALPTDLFVPDEHPGVEGNAQPGVKDQLKQVVTSVFQDLSKPEDQAIHQGIISKILGAYTGGIIGSR